MNFAKSMAIPGMMVLSAVLQGFTQCPATPPATDFINNTLIPGSTLNQPIEMTVASDGRVFVAERAGNIRVYNPTTGGHSVAGTFSTYLYSGAYDVGGVLGVAVGPNFASDNWLYVFYVPASTRTGAENNATGRMIYRLSRVQVLSNNTLNLSTEQTLLDVPAIWETHNGGSLRFGRNGDLYLSTGDNNAAGCSNQYSPMDERVGYEYCDDQRGTANTNSLLGKVLRIHPEQNLVNGLYYTIPSGNLFAPGTALTRPEIYAMGFRNPYRIFPDPVTGRLFIGMFGPAAGTSSARGPSGADILHVTDSPAFFGYPYTLKNNQPYCHWDYAAGACSQIRDPNTGNTYGTVFDPAVPRNYSRNNTGLNILPPARAAVMWEHDGSDPDPVPNVKGCGWGAGPVYHYNASLNSTEKFPPYFDNKWIFHGIGSGYQPRLVNMPAGPVVPITSSMVTGLPFSSTITFTSGVHDMEYGADGTLYVLDYGGSFYANNANDGLFQVTFNGCLPPPVAVKGGEKNIRFAEPGMVMPGQAIKVPMGAKHVQAFDLSGKVVWEKALDSRNMRETVIPASVGMGLLRVRYR